MVAVETLSEIARDCVTVAVSLFQAALIGILAVVVAVPMFTSEVRRTRCKTTEVTAMFAELASKQERYKNENNTYLVVPECPTPVGSTRKAVSACQGTGSAWKQLGIVPPEQKLRCSYEIYIGDSATAPTAPVGATVSIPTTYIATSWYMGHARCDMDNDGVVAHYVTSSFDATMQITREGE